MCHSLQYKGAGVRPTESRVEIVSATQHVFPTLHPSIPGTGLLRIHGHGRAADQVNHHRLWYSTA